MIGTILIHLQKNFYTFDHDILMKTLNTINFSNYTIGWFKSYISSQLFGVNLENSNSEPSNFTCGAPQRSILGPLLFLIYVNDMRQTVQPNEFLYGVELNQMTSSMILTLALFFGETML